MPGRRTSCTKAAPPVTLAGMSKRGIDWPTMRWRAAGFGATLAVASRLRSTSPASSPYVTLRPSAALMVPSATASVSAATPRCLAASSSRIARASAPAMRSAVPLFSTDWLPAVCPSLGVRPVSPEIMAIRSSGRSSSSAAICLSAVRMPWPSSTLPVNTVAVPSALMRSQASRRRLVCRLPESRAGSCAAARRGSSEKATTMAPRPAVKSRRVRNAFMSGPPHLVGRAQDGGNDPVVGAAAAEIAVEAGADVLFARPRIGVEQRLGRHDHAVAAVAALGGLLGDEGALQRARLFDCPQALDGGDLGVTQRGDRGHARAGRLAVDQHRAGTALSEPAAELRPVELEIVAQDVQ